ncbi:HNH endonuclease [Metabacillus litoralis]|uniref:HNH endonuclease n=1 Tax=Metabacillus litoralis TaxID=152268 RepID=UPI001CFEE07E|nr:HNH endonuclease [Metabacillus litoralis]
MSKRIEQYENGSYQSKLTVAISDSFVSRNKLRTERNASKTKPSSGESRIYIGSQSSPVASNFFSFTGTVKYLKNDFAASNANCFFLKSNLLEYLELAFKEYHEPAQNYFYDISEHYFELKEKLEDYSEEKIYFKVFNHRGKKDTERFYINSDSEIWSIFRKIALPHISTLSITKSVGPSQDEYEFLLSIKEKFVDREMPTVIREIYEDAEQYEEEETDALSLVTSRKGQGKFKNRLLETMKNCPFTGISDPILLRASHAKPWSESNNLERLDGYNGLLLTPTYDVLFDRGLISFEDDGTLMISPLVSKEIIQKLNLILGETYSISNGTGKRSPYLKYHRENIFKQ